MKNKTTFKDGWVNQMFDMVKLDPSVSLNMTDEELKAALCEIYDENVKSPNINIVNNYKGISVQLPLENVYDLISSDSCILAGDAVLFKKHEVETSNMVPVIIKYQNDRKKEKKEMFKYPKGTAEYMFHDRNQKNKKVVINALYGLFGYARFRFFNINIAQSVTTSGQLIISTATCCFENFLADNTKFVMFEEAVIFIDRIKKEYAENPNVDMHNNIRNIDIDDAVLRIAEHSYDTYTKDQANYIVNCIKSLSDDERQLLYYKNNLKRFHEVPFIHDLIQKIFDSIEQIRLGSMDAFDENCKFKAKAEPGAKELLEELIRYYDVFVLDTHQIFDRVRRTKYTPKKSVMYIDTDSNFVALEEFVDYFMERFTDKYNNREDFIFKCTSILTIVITHVITATYKEFAESMNISPEYGVRIRMKNEFLFSMLVFGTSKKRYFGNQIIQEGNLINDGKGEIEIKGFDFKKAATKKEIYDKICKMIFNTILDVNQITYSDVLRKANEFKDNIRNDVLNGSTLYYKQLSVSSPDKYKDPYKLQGIKGVLLWNAIVDKSMRMEFPAEVDIIPIPFDKFGNSKSKDPYVDNAFTKFLKNPQEFFEKNANNPKYSTLYLFYTKYPTEFSRMISTMLEHPNIWTKFPSSIAKPRAMVELPDWLKDIIDVDTIIHNNVNLINPILESVGVPIINEKLGPMYTTLVSL